MEKVKLTRDQRQTVKNFMNNGNILKLTVNELHKVIDGEYEVESEFKVGDWAVYESVNGYNKIREIIEIRHETYVYAYWSYPDELTWVSKRNIRHATPEEITKEKQRRWWAKHGREVWELSLYDSVITKEGHPFTISYIYRDYSGGTVKYELSNGAYYDKDDMEDKFKILYFAEDRKDI